MSASGRSISIVLQIEGAQQVQGQLQSTGQAVNVLVQQVEQLGPSVQSSSKGLTDVGTRAADTGTRMQGAAAQTQNFGKSMANAAGFLSTSAAAFTNVIVNLNQMERAQVMAERSTLMLHKAQLTYSQATEQVNKLQAEGKKGTLDYQQALAKQKNAQDAISIATDRQALAMDRLRDVQLLFFTSVIPSSVQGIGNMIAGFSNLRPAAASAAGAMETVGAASMSLNAKLGIIGAVIAAIGIALTAYAQNWGGFRDMINGIGVAIGNAVPPLKSLLEALQAFGNFVTPLLGGKVPDAAKKTGDSFTEMGDSIEGVTSQAEKDLTELNKTMDQFANTAGSSLLKAFKEGPKEIRKAIADIRNEIGFGLPGETVLPLQIALDDQEMTQQAQAAVGYMLKELAATQDMAQFKSVSTTMGSKIIENVQAGMATAGPGTKAAMQSIIDGLNTTMAATDFATFQQGLKKINEGIDKLNSPMSRIEDQFKDSKTAANGAAGGADNLSTALKGVYDSAGWIVPGIIPMNAIEEPMNKATAAVKKTTEQVKPLPSIFEQVTTGISETFAEAQSLIDKLATGKPIDWNQVFFGKSRLTPILEQIKTGIGESVTEIQNLLGKLATGKPIDWNQVFFGTSKLGLTDWLKTNVTEPAKQSWTEFQNLVDQWILKKPIDWNQVFFGKSKVDLLGAINTNIIQPMQTIPSKLSPIGAQIWGAITSAWTSTAGVLDQLIVQPILAIPGQVASIGQSIWLSITNAWGNLTATVNTNIVQPILKIPGQVASIGQSIWLNITNAWTSTAGVLDQLIVQPILAIPGQIGSIGQSIWLSLTNAWGNLTTIINTNIIQPILAIPGQLGNIGAQIQTNIVRGLGQIGGAIKGLILNGLQTIGTWTLSNPTITTMINSVKTGLEGIKDWSLGLPVIPDIVGTIKTSIESFKWTLPMPDIPKTLLDIYNWATGKAGVGGGAAGTYKGGNMEEYLQKGTAYQVPPTTWGGDVFGAGLPVGGAVGGGAGGAGQFSSMVAAAQAAVSQIVAAFQQLPTQLAPVFGSIGTLAQQTFMSLGTIATSTIPALSAAFSGLAASIAPAFGSITTLAQQIFDSLPAIATASFTKLKTAFSGIGTAIAPAFGSIGTLAQQIFNSLGPMATRSLASMVSAFQSASQRAAATMNTIISSANKAASAVQQVANAINALKNKTVTITVVTVYRSVYAQHGFHGIVSGPTPIIAGEAGPERVDITPLAKSASAPENQMIRNNVVSAPSAYTTRGGGYGGGYQQQQQPININLTLDNVTKLDGEVIARNQQQYNMNNVGQYY